MDKCSESNGLFTGSLPFPTGHSLKEYPDLSYYFRFLTYLFQSPKRNVLMELIPAISEPLDTIVS